jgi:polyhydroxyalkanoic acid synthase PhaR subunit
MDEMPEANGRSDASTTQEVAEIWRNWLTDTERQWNSFFNDVMGTDQFGRLAGNYVEGFSVLQRALNEGMERYLNTFNLPTHSDVVEIGERLHNIEERLANLEANLSNIASSAGVTIGAPVTRLQPRRTRKPQGSTNSNSN